MSAARTKQARAEADAATAMGRAARASSASIAATYARQAERAQATAVSESKKVADLSKKVAEHSKKEAELASDLDRAMRNAAAAEKRERERRERDERARQAAAQSERRRRDQADALARARVDARLDRTDAAIRQLLKPPKREILRLLYVTASSEGDLRVDHEVRRVKAAVRAATHRDLVEIEPLLAATPGDLLDGVARFRPHVLHFSGHAGPGLLVLDQDTPSPNPGHAIAADAFKRVIKAVDSPPVLVVLNACDSAPQAAALTDTVPFAIGMGAEIDDVDAIVFATRFYSAVAEGQSVGAAFELARLEMELNGLAGASLPELHADADTGRVLVLPQSAADESRHEQG